MIDTWRTNSSKRRLDLVAVGVSLLILMASVTPASGQHVNQSLKEADVALLPTFCRHSQTFMEAFGSKQEQAYWYGRLGPDFKHVHHYCWAAAALHRTNQTRDSRSRDWLLKNAVSDATWVIEKVAPTFELLPDVYITRAKAYAGRKEDKAANEDFRIAVALRPDYWRSYFEWATYLSAKGLREEARMVISKGREQIPTSKVLQRLEEQL
jgi:hypothetical protein